MIAEATQLYIFAAQPPRRAGRREIEKADAAAQDLRPDPPRARRLRQRGGDDREQHRRLRSRRGGEPAPRSRCAAQSLYFCIPRNPKLMALWDTVEDRLFKIRHCLNIDGLATSCRSSPPDRSGPAGPRPRRRARPADVLADLAAPRAPYRFSYLIGRRSNSPARSRASARRCCRRWRSATREGLAQLRSQHEITIQKAMRNVRDPAARPGPRAGRRAPAEPQGGRGADGRLCRRQPMIGPEKKQLGPAPGQPGLGQGSGGPAGRVVDHARVRLPVRRDQHREDIRLGNIVGAIAGMAGSTAAAPRSPPPWPALPPRADAARRNSTLQVKLAGGGSQADRQATDRRRDR